MTKKKGGDILPYSNELLAAGKTVAQFLAGVGDLAVGFPIFQASLAWEQNRENEKTRLLLETLKKELETNSTQLAHVTTLLNTPRGYVLFKKVSVLNRKLEIEEGIFSEFTKIQSEILVKIAEQDFETLFSEICYSLNSLEKLSPQAIWLLNDFENWPHVFTAGGTTTSGVTLDGNWAIKWSDAYLGKNGRSGDVGIKQRVIEVISELRNYGFVDLDDSKRVKLTRLGTTARDLLL